MEMMIQVKYKITGTEKVNPVAFREFNQQSWHDKLQTPQLQAKNTPILELKKKKKKRKT